MIGKATVVIVAEYKTPKPGGEGARLCALHLDLPHQRARRRSTCGSTSHSRLNLIQALIQAIHAGADEALMLDPRGFVASCNSTNFFIVRRGELWTSTGALFSFKGITQQQRDRGVDGGAAASRASATSRWRRCTRPDEAFVTGTLGGVTPVTKVDGRVIGEGRLGALDGPGQRAHLLVKASRPPRRSRF